MDNHLKKGEIGTKCQKEMRITENTQVPLEVLGVMRVLFESLQGTFPLKGYLMHTKRCLKKIDFRPEMRKNSPLRLSFFNVVLFFSASRRDKAPFSPIPFSVFITRKSFEVETDCHKV